jgi:hypothetical protein
MNFYKKLNLDDRDYERYFYEIDLVDNVMEHIGSLFVLDKRNNIITEEILEDNFLPKKITHLKLKILPTENNKFYYSFSGIETIVFNLFNNLNKKRIKEDLERCKTYFKVYYIKDEMYNVPILCLDLIFLKKLLNETIEFLWKKLKVEVFFFTGNVGDIKVIDFITPNKVSKVLKIPLLVGYPEFKNEGVLKTYNFSDEQIKDMNTIHGVPVMKIDMKKIINNSTLSLFDEMRELIKKSNNEVDTDDLTEDEVDDIVYNLFGTNDNDEIKDIIMDDYDDNDLPF